MFDIINRKHDDTTCFVCSQNPDYVFIYWVNDKMRTVRDNSITISKVTVTQNVGCADDGTCYVYI